MNKDIWCVVADEVYHQDSMMFADPDWVMFSGTKQECKDYIALQNECAQGQDLLDQQSISDAYEEMYELDPRDHQMVDDYGDPIT